jgi:hypothetical protein
MNARGCRRGKSSAKPALVSFKPPSQWNTMRLVQRASRLSYRQLRARRSVGLVIGSARQ